MSNDDKDLPLLHLCRHHRTSIISQLIDIASKRNQQDHAKSRSFITRLQCIQSKGIELRRKSINAFYERRYVALSYTWDPSPYECQHQGRYLIENWDNKQLEPSSVRDCVLDRILRYMHHTDVRFLWIDRHCICQDPNEGKGCAGHACCVEQQIALQAMDLVYHLSEHPVALLGRPLRTKSELHLLERILAGTLVAGDHTLQPSVTTGIRVAQKALLLLTEITKDRWWGRAWTFQENYRGGKRMRLLMRHDPSLEPQKLRHSIFGVIPGELCLSSVEFSEQATRLCRALHGTVGLRRLDKKRINYVLQMTGRYKRLLPCSSSMTPAVMADIEARGLSDPWDRLAIMANCCQYQMRLNGSALSAQGRSISISLLAMCLLNGEILDNGDNGPASVSGLTVSGFLQKTMFQRFGAPEGTTRRLTFNKRCRLTNVRLTTTGISTKGHLWKLGPIIDTAECRRKLPRINVSRGRLKLVERRCLLQLIFRLYDLGYRWLAGRIDEYLATDARAGDEYLSFTDMYLHHMATELAAAIMARRKLRLGSIWPNSKPNAWYRAIFVWSDRDEDGLQPPATWAFTSARKAAAGSQALDHNDIDRHVSLTVDAECLQGGGAPQLRVRGWLLGMCLFNGRPRTKVVFPWPRVLWEVRP